MARPGRRRTSGMTLIELLVALSVSVLVMASAVSVYCAMTGSLRRLQTHRLAPAHAALEQLRQDFSQCAQIPSTNVSAFLLESVCPDTNAPCRSVVGFSIGSLPAPEADFSSMDVTRIRYSLIPGKSGGEGVLVRETMSLWGSNALAPSVSNVILGRVVAFEVAVLVETSWTNNWSSSGRLLLPRAARLRVDWQSDTLLETARLEVFIPAGNMVPGTLPAR